MLLCKFIIIKSTFPLAISSAFVPKRNFYVDSQLRPHLTGALNKLN